jgi:hypothetical protein
MNLLHIYYSSNKQNIPYLKTQLPVQNVNLVTFAF